ncbi:hypothetical protein Y032_0049g1839 [Ancylostoma ceylanicum]|uniref:Uncharacterized protein n=1 Tax=Ancylostoma ceylanicum TaxID=53326 RepID=A0A016U9A8_9BILA|nr:hypothetical protein Y032_0049g1839 [Ancylostoma ceylanicum]
MLHISWTLQHSYQEDRIACCHEEDFRSSGMVALRAFRGSGKANDIDAQCSLTERINFHHLRTPRGHLFSAERCKKLKNSLPSRKAMQYGGRR